MYPHYQHRHPYDLEQWQASRADHSNRWPDVRPPRHHHHRRNSFLTTDAWRPPTAASSSWMDGRDAPGPTRQDLERLKDRSLPASSSLGLREEEAIRLAISKMEEDHYSRSTVTALGAHLDLEPMHLYPREQMPFRLFDELDKELFRGVLKGQVYLKWARGMPSHLQGVTSSAGKRHPRITIELNDNMCVTQVLRSDVLATLIHHMTHAYLLACCGFHENGENGKHDLGHGLPFSALLHKIQRVFFSGKGFPSLFTCRSRHGWNARINPLQDTGVGCSNCTGTLISVFSSEECAKYYRGLEIAKSAGKSKEGEESLLTQYPRELYLLEINPQNLQWQPKLRSEFGHQNASFIELRYSGQAIAISASKVTAYPSLRTQVQALQGSPKALEVPASFNEEFMCFYLFLQNGDYPANVWEISNANAAPSVITDVRAYAIARKTGFEELKKRAIERFYQQFPHHGDKMEALEEIYDRLDSTTRGNELREAIRSWLLRPPHATSGTSNLCALMDSSVHGPRFVKLRSKGGHFLEDCDEVGRRLMNNRDHATNASSFFSATQRSPATGTSGRVSPMYAPQPTNAAFHKVYGVWGTGDRPAVFTDAAPPPPNTPSYFHPLGGSPFFR